MEWLRGQRERRYLAGVVFGVLLAVELTSLSIPLRILAGAATGMALIGEMRWEARRPENRVLVRRVVLLAAGWWMFAFGVIVIACGIVFARPWTLSLGLIAL